MKKQKKNNKGITLVALVITIIVMLILVGVTITLVADGNLIKNAKRAATETEKAADLEILQQATVGAMISGTFEISDMSSSDEFTWCDVNRNELPGTPTDNTEGHWVKMNNNGNFYFIDSTGNILDGPKVDFNHVRNTMVLNSEINKLSDISTVNNGIYPVLTLKKANADDFYASITIVQGNDYIISCVLGEKIWGYSFRDIDNYVDDEGESLGHVYKGWNEFIDNESGLQIVKTTELPTLVGYHLDTTGYDSTQIDEVSILNTIFNGLLITRPNQN